MRGPRGHVVPRPTERDGHVELAAWCYVTTGSHMQAFLFLVIVAISEALINTSIEFDIATTRSHDLSTAVRAEVGRAGDPAPRRGAATIPCTAGDFDHRTYAVLRRAHGRSLGGERPR